MKILHTPVWKYALAIFVILTGFILGLISIIYFIAVRYNPSFTWYSYLPYAILIIIVLFGMLWLFANHRFFHVTPSASFAFPWNAGPWLHIQSNPQTSMTINWITAENTSTKVELKSLGRHSGATSIFEGLAGKIHHIALENLEPDTEYEYKILNFPHNAGPHSFRTATPQPNSFKFVVLGDSQNGGGDQVQGWGLLPLLDTISAKNPDLVVSVGDYCDQGNDLKSWKVTLNAMEKISGKWPIQVAVGNHDTGTNYMQDKTSKVYPDDGANFDYIFGYKYEVPADEDQITAFKGRYYSLEYPNALFLFIDTNNSAMAEPRNPQWAWIRNKLQNVAKDKWKIMVFHRDLVDIRKQENGTYTYKYDKFAQYLLPLLAEFHVDLVIQGHNHIFQLMNYTENQFPLCLITSGGAGNDLRRNTPLTNKDVKIDGYVMQEDSTHYLWVEINADVARIEARYPDDSVLHKFEVHKKH